MTWATFYLVCFVMGFALSLISLFGGFGDTLFHEIFPSLHIDHAGLGDGSLDSAEGHGGTAGVHASPFNFSTLMAFLAWFGGTGYLLTRYSGLWAVLALGLAILGGLAGAAIVFWFLVKVLLANERRPVPQHARGWMRIVDEPFALVAALATELWYQRANAVLRGYQAASRIVRTTGGPIAPSAPYMLECESEATTNEPGST